MRKEIRKTKPPSSPAAAVVPHAPGKAVALLFMLLAGAGMWAGSAVERALYAPVHNQIEMVGDTRPRLLPAPVPICTPTPGPEK